MPAVIGFPMTRSAGYIGANAIGVKAPPERSGKFGMM
jgi:hypothetical protein